MRTKHLLMAIATLLVAGCSQNEITEVRTVGNLNPEKPDVPLNKNDAFQKVQKRRVQEKR